MERRPARQAQSGVALVEQRFSYICMLVAAIPTSTIDGSMLLKKVSWLANAGQSQVSRWRAKRLHVDDKNLAARGASGRSTP